MIQTDFVENKFPDMGMSEEKQEPAVAPLKRLQYLTERVQQLETELAYERHLNNAMVTGNIPEGADMKIILAAHRTRGYLNYLHTGGNYYDAKSVYRNEQTEEAA